MSVFRGASVGITLTANKSRYSAEVKAARAELRGWQKDVQQGQVRFRNAASSIGKAAAIGFGAAGTAAVLAGVKMVDMAGDAAEVGSKLEVTFGSRLPKITSKLDAFSRATGASRYELQRQAADMGALLKPIGLTNTELDNMSVKTVQLATDLSSFNNVPVAEAIRSLRSGLVGEIEPLRRFGILINETRVKQEAYRLGLAKTGDVLTEGAKVQARYSLILQQSRDAQGDAVRTSDQYVNTMRRIQNAATDAQIQLGQAMLPAVTELANGLATFVQGDTFGTWVDQLGGKLGEASQDVTQFLTSAQGQETLHQFAAGARDAWTAVQQVAGALTGATMFLVRHRDAVVGAAIGYASFRTVTSIITPLNAAWQLGQVRALQFASANATASRSAVVARGAMGALGGPVGLAATGIGLLATGVFLYKQKQNDANEASKRAATALYDQARAAGTLYESQLALQGARLDVKESADAVRRAEEQLAATKPGTAAHVSAALVLERAKNNLSQAQIRSGKTADEEREKQEAAVRSAQTAAKELNKIAVARQALADMRAIINDPVKKEHIVTRDELLLAKSLRRMEEDEKKHLAAIRKIREDGRGDFERIDGRWVVTAGRQAAQEAANRRRFMALGTQWSAKELARLSGQLKPHIDSANKQIERTGDVKLSRAKIERNLVKPFDNIGATISNRIGKITVDIAAMLDFGSGTGKGSGWPLMAGGGLGRGSVSNVDMFTPMAGRAGLTLTSGYRPGDDGYHGVDRARDYSNSSGPTPQMYSFAMSLAAAYGANLSELIYTPLGFSIKNGKRVSPYAEAQHYNHVHVAFQRGGMPCGCSSCLKRQQGGSIPRMRIPDWGLGGSMVPGWGSGDKIPTLTEPGEGILNRNATAALGGAGFINWANSAWPRFQTGGYVDAARRAATIADSPQLTLDDILRRTVATTTAMNRRIEYRNAAANRKDAQEVARLNGIIVQDRETLRDLAAQQVAAERAVEQAREDARSAANAAAETAQQAAAAAAQAAADAAAQMQAAAEASAEAERQRLAEARAAELAIPRSAMSLRDALDDHYRAIAASSKGLEDDIARAHERMASERERTRLIEERLARTDLNEEERAGFVRDLTSSYEAQRQLEESIDGWTSTIKQQAEEAAGGATLDDLLKELKATTQALYEMGAVEAGNVFQVAKLEQVIPAETGAQAWKLLTEAQLQGAV